MEEARFIAWLSKDGEAVSEGQPLFTVEGDKATQDVESTAAGILRRAPDGPSEGDTILVGRMLGWILAPGEPIPTGDPAGAGDATGSTTSEAPSGPPTATPAASHHPTEPSRSPHSPPGPPAHGHPASPRARRAARDLGVDLATLNPTGRGGRLRERDVLAAASGNTASEGMGGVPAGWRAVPTPPMRRIIATRLVQARRDAVPVTLTTRVDATALVAMRRRLKAAAAGPGAPTLNDVLLKLTAQALRAHPMLAAVWAGDRLFLPESIHLGLAVDTEAGLRVPVVRRVDTSTLEEVAAATRRLIADARSGRIGAADLQGGCFTVSNLGSLGIEAFTPVPNPPESAILGVGAIVREAVPDADDGFTARDRMTLSLSFDHRVNDGAGAARFLQTLRGLIETPNVPTP